MPCVLPDGSGNPLPHYRRSGHQLHWRPHPCDHHQRHHRGPHLRHIRYQCHNIRLRDGTLQPGSPDSSAGFLASVKAKVVNWPLLFIQSLTNKDGY